MAAYTNLEDNQIVKRVLEGEIDAFEVLVVRYQSQMRAYFFPQVCGFRESAAITDDLVQNLFVRVYTHLDGFNPGKGSFQKWLYQRARSVVSNFLRKPQHRNETADDSHIGAAADEAQSANSPIIERMICVNQQLQRLKPKELELYMLYYREERNQAEIARIWRCSARTIKRRMQKLIPKVTRLLQKCVAL